MKLRLRDGALLFYTIDDYGDQMADSKPRVVAGVLRSAAAAYLSGTLSHIQVPTLVFASGGLENNALSSLRWPVR